MNPAKRDGDPRTDALCWAEVAALALSGIEAATVCQEEPKREPLSRLCGDSG